MRNCECEVEHINHVLFQKKKKIFKNINKQNANDLFKQIKVKILPFFFQIKEKKIIKQIKRNFHIIIERALFCFFACVKILFLDTNLLQKIW